RLVGGRPPQAPPATPKPTPRPPSNPAPTQRPPSNPGPNAPDPRPVAQEGGPLGTVPPTSTAVDAGKPSGAEGLIWVVLLTAALAAMTVRGAPLARGAPRRTHSSA